jgi:hypothetical protein
VKNGWVLVEKKITARSKNVWTINSLKEARLALVEALTTIP